MGTVISPLDLFICRPLLGFFCTCNLCFSIAGHEREASTIGPYSSCRWAFRPFFVSGFSMSAKLELLENLIAPVAESLGCELWGLDYIARPKSSLLRIYIDKENGIDVKDCERVSRQVSAVMDVEDPIAGEYTLEVSSPGMDRPLFKLEHFAAYAGQNIKLKLRTAFEGRRKFSGLLKGVEDDEVVLQVDQEEYLLPYELIDKANVVPTF